MTEPGFYRIVDRVPDEARPSLVPWGDYVAALKGNEGFLEFEFQTKGAGLAFAKRARTRPEFKVAQRETKVYLSLKAEEG